VEVSVQGLPPLQAYLEGSRTMTAPAAAATVATAVELHPGDPRPPSPPPPPGFSLADRDDGPTTSLVTYRAPEPAPVDPAAVGATALAGGDAGGVLWLP
jgi:hypothetical protein